MPHWAIVLLVLAWPVYMVVLSVWVIMQRSEPVATLGWIMALAFLPYIGFLIYFFFGPQRIKRSADGRKASQKAIGGRGQAHAVSEGSAAGEGTELGRMTQVMTGFPPSTASRVDLLIDGGATYDALVKAIAAAQRHVHVEYYIYAGDRTGTRIRDALVERAKAGVKVRVLLDGVGSKLKRKFVRPLHEAGVELAFFHPVRWWMLPFARPKLNMRSHRKIVVCDGRIGFTGGINVTDDENETLNEKAFHDLHLRVEGEAVRWLQVAWLEDWHYATDKEVADQGLYPEPSEPGPISAQVIPAGPDNEWEPIHRTQVDAIHRARRRVWLATPYFVPSRAALFALEGAAMSGLDVRLVVPKRSDSRLVTAATRSYFDKLLKAGVRVYEYGPRMLHSKVLLVDDDLAIVGTSNFDTRSFSLNFEIVMLFRDEGVTGKLEASLKSDMAAAKEITAGSRKPSFLSSFSEDTARLFSPLL